MNLRDQLQHIYDDRGVLTPAVLVDVARDKEHPLHDRFEWNDQVAGEQYRLNQAGRLIRSVKVRFTSPTTEDQYSVRAWHPVREDDGKTFYEPAAKIAGDPLLMKLSLRNMERDYYAFKRRYERMHEFWDLLREEVQKREIEDV